MKSLLFIFIIVTFYKHVTCYMRVCYYTNWSQYRPNGAKFTPENINPSLCSHIIYAFAKLDGNSLGAYEWNDQSTQWTEGMYAKVLKHKQTNPALKILLAVGGWNTGSPPFSNMTLTGATRQYFINSTLHFLRQHNFDGIDIDWEYPARRGGRPEDRNNLALLLSDFKSAFDQNSYETGLPRLLLSAAVPAGKDNIDAGFDIPNVVRSLDFINVMTYDLHGSWDPLTGHNSPLYGRADESKEDALLNMNWAVKYWIQMGAPKHKLLAGIGLYGRSFTLQTPANNGFGAATIGAGRAGIYTREPGFLSFYEVCQELSIGATRVWNDEHKVPYLYNGDQWVAYDDAQSVREKTQWAMKNNLGGIMVWSLDLDDFNGEFCNKGRYPLLTAINEELGVIKPASVQPDTIDSSKLTILPQDPTNITASQPRNLAADADRKTKPGPQTSGQAVQHGSGLPVVISDAGDRARLSLVPIESFQSPQTVFVYPAPTPAGIHMNMVLPTAQVRQERSTHFPNMRSGANNMIPSDFNTRLLGNFNLSNTLDSIPLNLVHDHPPEVVRIGQVTADQGPPMAGVMHHARPVPDTPLAIVDSAGTALDPHALQAPVIIADTSATRQNMAVAADPTIQIVPLDPHNGHTIHEIHPVGQLEGASVILPQPAHDSRQTRILTRPSARREGISLSDVRPAPTARPFLEISSNSSSSSSSSSSQSQSNSRTISLGGGPSGLGINLQDLFHDNPTSGSSSSVSSAASAGNRQSTPIDRGQSLIPVKVINNPSDISLPPGSSIEAVIPVNSIDNLAEVLASLGSTLPSGSVSSGHSANNLNPDHLMQELDLSNILGGASLGGGSVSGVSSGSTRGSASGVISTGSAVSQPQDHGLDMHGIHGVDSILSHPPSHRDDAVQLQTRSQPSLNPPVDLRALLGLTSPLGNLDSALLSPSSAPQTRAPSRQVVSPSLAIQRQPRVQQTPPNVDEIRRQLLLRQQIQNALRARQRLALQQQPAPRTDQLPLRVAAQTTPAPVINTRALQLAQQRARQQLALRQQQQQQQQQDQLRQQQMEQLLQQQQQQQREQLLQQQRQQQQQQRTTTDLSQLTDEQLRRVLNRLDVTTLRRLINSGLLSLTPNVERPTPLAAQPQRPNRSSGVSPQSSVGTVGTQASGRFRTDVLRPNSAADRGVVFISNNAPSSNLRDRLSSVRNFIS